VKTHYPQSEYRLPLVIHTASPLNILLQLVQRLKWPELLHEVLKRSEGILGTKLWYEQCGVLSLAGVPTDDEELLREGAVTCSLHLMIWMCLKAKYPSSRGYYRFINYIIETIHTHTTK